MLLMLLVETMLKRTFGEFGKRLVKCSEVKKEQRHTTNKKQNMHLNIFNKNNQYFDLSYKSSSG